MLFSSLCLEDSVDLPKRFMGFVLGWRLPETVFFTKKGIGNDGA